MVSQSSAAWFGRGALQLFSMPALILSGAFVGFAGLAKQSGVDATEAMLMTLMVWALPSKIILVGAIASGTGLAATALAVALSAVRFMMMISAIVPEIRDRDTRTSTLLFLSHFVAITAYVLTMERVQGVPRDHRTVWFAGMGMTITLFNTALVGLVYQFSAALPAVVMAVLYFVTPMYFLTSLWATARDHVVKLAMVFGLVLGPLAHIVAPQFDLLIAGFAGGVLAWLAGRMVVRP